MQMDHRVRRRRIQPGVESLDVRRLLSAGYAPAQVREAYGFSSISLPAADGRPVVADGSGQTIALVVAYHNPTLQSDLKVFNETFGLPEADVRVVNLGDQTTDRVWAAESAMDVQWAHAFAPGASIVLVEAASDSADDILKAVDVAKNTPGVSVVSMSFGFTETAGQHVYDSLFTTPAGHTPVTFIASSGDHGATGGAMYPASSPNVLGVGGTSLNLDASGKILSETVWSGSGSGPARYAARPTYQRTFQQGTKKSTPDVLFLGDPTTGVQVYHTDPGETSGTWRQVAGTSLGAPAWGALIAIVNQGRALLGKASLDGPSETLPLLYAQGASSFRTILGGASTTAGGLGSPKAESLVPALVAQGASHHATAPPVVTPSTPTVNVVPNANARAARRRQPVRRVVATPTPRETPTMVRPPALVRRATILRMRGLTT